MKLSDHERAARNESTASRMRGGRLELCGGSPIERADEPIGERPILAVVKLPDSRVSVRGDRAGIVARGMAKSPVSREGRPTWWRAFSKDGVAIAFGLVLSGEDAAAAFAKATEGGFPGVAVEQATLWRGMEIDFGEMRMGVEQ